MSDFAVIQPLEAEDETTEPLDYEKAVLGLARLVAQLCATHEDEADPFEMLDDIFDTAEDILSNESEKVWIQ